MEKITAAIITLNEEKRIERCLKSLDWVDEIVIIDSFSTDRTVDICKRYTQMVFQHVWPNNYAEQKTRAHEHASHDWILFLDADEVVTRALRDEIVAMFKVGPVAQAFAIPRIALVGSIKDARVFVARNGVASLRQVVIGRQSSDLLEAASGLEAGDSVVVSGQNNLVDQARVQVVSLEK